MSINQNDRISRSPFFKGITTNKLNPASFCVTKYHLGGQFISPESQRPEVDMKYVPPQSYPVTQEEAGFNLYQAPEGTS